LNPDPFLDSAELYEAIYHFKDYARESGLLRDLIAGAVPGARTILDVACGTGGHAQFLKETFAVDGIDLNPGYLRAAQIKNPAGNYVCADMTGFDLGRTYDAVICLFSAIGNVKTVDRLQRAISCMALHLRPGGLLIVEPWFTPDQWRPGAQYIYAGEIGGNKVCRMSVSAREGNLSVLLFHYLYATADGIEHHSERLDLALFTRDEMTRAFQSAAMEVRYDPQGLMGRGLYLGWRRR
jgi:SAM-dependent methyltransferase